MMMMMVRLFHCTWRSAIRFRYTVCKCGTRLHCAGSYNIIKTESIFIWLTSPNVKPQKRTENVYTKQTVPNIHKKIEVKQKNESKMNFNQTKRKNYV